MSFWIGGKTISPLVSLYAFFVATFGLFLAGRRTQEVLRQNDIAEQGQATERYTHAVEQLGHEHQEVRMGGLYALGRIAEESPEERPEERRQAIEILAGFVRSRGAIQYQKDENGNIKRVNNKPIPELSKPRSEKIDIETAIKILADIVKDDERLIKDEEEEENKTYLVDLSRTDLRDLFLGRKNLRVFAFQKALLSDIANPIDLEGVYLMEAFLVDADLTKADLYQANLTQANLYKANLTGVNGSRANLTSVRLFRADLTNADLSHANLTDADLFHADLTNARLDYTDLTSAKMKFATGLTREQLATIRYKKEKPPELPEGIDLPKKVHNIIKPSVPKTKD